MRERDDLWVEFINREKVATVLELGVWRGEFAETILRRCPTITHYYMLDPWRHLPAWNKPLNVDETEFQKVFAQAKDRTDFAGNRRVILRGTTTEVIDQIADGSLDLAYIDGDHSLRGIAIDLTRAYEKVRSDGFIGGDDLEPDVWAHGAAYEPTLVFPFAVYFAEAKGHPIEAIGHHQFLIRKGVRGFRFARSEDYGARELLAQMLPIPQPTFLERGARKAIRLLTSRLSG